MLAGPPPVKIIAPGNVFRRDDDATHTPMFPQVEGLHVDRDVSFEDLKATLVYFVRQFFGPSMQHPPAPQLLPLHRAVGRGGRLLLRSARARRPPAQSCRLCKGTGWIEIGGCGMVHPNVLQGGRLRQARRHRLRLRHGAVAHGDAQVRRATICGSSTRMTCVFSSSSGPAEGAAMKVSFELAARSCVARLEAGRRAGRRGGRPGPDPLGLEVEGIEAQGTRAGRRAGGRGAGDAPAPGRRQAAPGARARRRAARRRWSAAPPNVPAAGQPRGLGAARRAAARAGARWRRARSAGVMSPGHAVQRARAGAGRER